MNEVKRERHYFADFIYGGSDAGHKWVEPKEEEDSALYLDANFEKAFKIDDISSVFHYDLVAENGGLHSFITGERKGEILCSDGMLHEGETTSLPLACSISLGIEDHYLDVDFAKKVPDLDCEFCDEVGCVELGVGNLQPDIHSAGASNEEVGVSASSISVPQYFNDQLENRNTVEMHNDSRVKSRYGIHFAGTSKEEVGVSASSALVPQCFNDQLENRNTIEMHNNLRVNSRYEKSFEDKMGSNSSLACDIQDFGESNNDRNTLEIRSTFGLDGAKIDFSLPSVEVPSTFIHAHDEFSPVIPCTEVQDSSLSSVDAPCTSIRAHDESSDSPCTKVQDSSVDDLSSDSCAETMMVRGRQRRLCRPPQRYLDGSQWLMSRLQREKNHPTSLLKDKDLGVKSQKKHRKKALKLKASRTRANKLELSSDEDYEPLMSCFNSRNFKDRIDRRKSCQPWTLDEVVSLVDGMSKYGVGQWTAVKRSFFSCSCRTATDIRDKWRNLVKTNCRSSKRREVDQHLRSGSQLPKPVIDRVRELADASVLMPKGRGGQKHSM